MKERSLLRSIPFWPKLTKLLCLCALLYLILLQSFLILFEDLNLFFCLFRSFVFLSFWLSTENILRYGIKVPKKPFSRSMSKETILTYPSFEADDGCCGEKVFRKSWVLYKQYKIFWNLFYYYYSPEMTEPAFPNWPLKWILISEIYTETLNKLFRRMS